jgi:hypothetical protein
VNDCERDATLYRYYSHYDRLLYVGITACGPSRGSAHGRGAEWWPLVERATFMHGMLAHVRIAERFAI